MPSSATITSFYSFSANTKARSSQVNQNFSNFRGHIIPIDPNTTTAATTETYDLGVDDHRWRSVYCRDIDFSTSTSTASLVLSGDTAVTTGAFKFKIEGTTKAVIDTNGIDGAYIKTASVTQGSIHPAALGLRRTEYTSGSGNHTNPTGTSNILVEIIGGGGGGGGGGGTIGGGGGGGAAAYAVFRYFSGLTDGQLIPYSVGSGGNGGGAATSGSSGTASTFNSLTLSPGGPGGTNGTNAGAGGAGGTSAGFGIGAGGSGGRGGEPNNGGSQADGGASYGMTYAGGTAQSAGGVNTARGGGGGSSWYGIGGTGGTGGTAGANATTTSYGAGGQGGGGSNPTGLAGGNGAGGLIRIWY